MELNTVDLKANSIGCFMMKVSSDCIHEIM